MNAPLWISRELKYVDPLYFAIYNPRIKEWGDMSCGNARWQIRKWNGVYPKPLSHWKHRSEVIVTLCDEQMTKDGLIDNGYADLDMRIITAMRKSNHWKNQWKKEVEAIDRRNDMRHTQANDELEYQSRYVAKRIYKAMREPSVFVGGQKYGV